jgi:hypothetical protein
LFYSALCSSDKESECIVPHTYMNTLPNVSSEGQSNQTIDNTQ